MLCCLLFIFDSFLYSWLFSLDGPETQMEIILGSKKKDGAGRAQRLSEVGFRQCGE